MEKWKDIPGYEGMYQAHPEGMIRNIKTNIVLKQTLDNNGYLYVGLSGRKIAVHRVIASTFLDNSNNFPIVNHKNEIKTDNRVINLEWCTYKYNFHYSKCWINDGPTGSKPVLQFTKSGNFVAEYESTMDAQRKTGIHNQSISACCLGKKYKSAGGYIWKYKE